MKEFHPQRILRDGNDWVHSVLFALVLVRSLRLGSVETIGIEHE